MRARFAVTPEDLPTTLTQSVQGWDFPFDMIRLKPGWVELHPNFTENPWACLVSDAHIRKVLTELCALSRTRFAGEPRLSAGRLAWARVRTLLSPQIFERDGYRCLSCGTEAQLTVDHIVPVARGGGHELSNLQTLCRSCNSRKGISLWHG